MSSPTPARCLLALALGALAACGRSEPPNVVLVTLDTTRPDYFSCYGFEPGNTPHFDALARSGARFERAMSASAVTPVSHVTILTGKYPYTHGSRVLFAEGGFRLRKSQRTLAQALAERRYTTAAVHSALPVSRPWGFDRDFQHFDSIEGSVRLGDRGASWDTEHGQRRSDETTDRVLELLPRLAEPFFLWIHYWDPHDVGLLPPDEFLEGVPIKQALATLRETGQGPRDYFRLADATYAREVRFVDHQFGRVVAALADRGALERTLLAVTADHGEGLSDGEEIHGWRAHRMVYREQIQVPLILSGPGIASGRVVPELVRTADITPTIYDYLGIAPEPDWDGRSLRPLIDGEPDEPRIAYADQINGYDLNAKMTDGRPDAMFLYCVMDADWKLVYRPHMPHASELFHTREDPEERVDVLAGHPDVVARLLGDLARRKPWVLAPFEKDPEANADLQNALAQVGYAGGNELHAGAWAWMCPRHPDHRDDGPDPPPHECGSPLVPVGKQ